MTAAEAQLDVVAPPPQEENRDFGYFQSPPARRLQSAAGRDARNDLDLRQGRVFLGTGGAALTVLDLATGRARPGELADIARIGRLVDALPNVHFYLRPCVPQDTPREWSGKSASGPAAPQVSGGT